MCAQLYIVATPIGHLEDISFRAINTLNTVSIIAAEDTRLSKQLLNHYNISTPLTACHDHNENHLIPSLIKRILSGESIALISDAGTPLISDPGFKLVREAQRNNIKVVPIPGPCAAIAALSSLGIASDRFSFEGFLPSKASQRQQRLEQLKNESQTLIFYEAPHRIVSCVKDIALIFGPNRVIGFAREISKTFETIKSMPAAELLTWIEGDNNQQKGEMVLVVSGHKKELTDDTITQHDPLLKRLLQDLTVKSTAEIAADITGLKKKLFYDRAIELKKELN